jgi:hypothetical protein
MIIVGISFAEWVFEGFSNPTEMQPATHHALWLLVMHYAPSSSNRLESHQGAPNDGRGTGPQQRELRPLAAGTARHLLSPEIAPQ